MKKIITLTLCLLALALAANAQRKTKDSSGLLYKITGKGLKKPSYLYGTIHIICQNEMFGMSELTSYIGQVDQVLMEVDMDDQTEMTRMQQGAILPDGKTIKEFLTPDQYAKVDELFRNYVGVSVDDLKNYRPMFLAVMISISPKAIGCKPPLGSYDMSFVQTAVTNKKPIFGLETVSSQYEKFDRRPLADQVKDLYEMALDPQRSIDEYKGLVAAYKAQSSDALYKLINGNLVNNEFERSLLDERNIDWAPKIDKAVKQTSSFIAVGGGHLGGKNGVVNLLKKKGYRLTPVRLK